MKYLTAFILLLCLSSAANAHEWYARHRDPIFNKTTCCGGTDCAPLPESAISITPNGDLHVFLSLAQAKLINPARTEAFDEIIPFVRIQQSEDGRPHICLQTENHQNHMQGFYCIFLPPAS